MINDQSQPEFNFSKFKEELTEIKILKDKNIFTVAEYDMRRSFIMYELKNKKFTDTSDKMLLQFSSLADEGLLTTEELMRIKNSMNSPNTIRQGAA